MERWKDVLLASWPRIAAAVAAGVVSFLQHQFGGDLPEGFEMSLRDFLVGLVVYSLSHRGISSKVNPGDAATMGPVPPPPNG